MKFNIFSRILTEYGDLLRKSPYSVRMRENADQKNSEHGHFLRCVDYKEVLNKKKSRCTKEKKPTN